MKRKAMASCHQFEMGLLSRDYKLLEDGPELLRRSFCRLGVLKDPTMGKLSKFDAAKHPSMALAQFIQRVPTYTTFTPACGPIAAIYVRRACLPRGDHLVPSAQNVHRVLLTALLLATKFLDDDHDRNGQFAKIGGITLEEMNELEIDLLIRLDHRLNVQVLELELLLTQLEQVDPVEVEEVVDQSGRTEEAFREFKRITARRCRPLGLRLNQARGARFVPTC